MTVDQCAALSDVLFQMEQAARFSPCYLAVKVMPLLLAAIPLTLMLTLVCGVIGNLLAVPVAVARISPNPLLWVPSYCFILLMRGTPLIVQIYLIYYGLGQVFGDIRIGGEPLMRVLPFLRDGIWYAIFALSINTAGYSGEILRGAILAVPHGEIEAGRAFGMSRWMIFRRVTLPRAIRICLPAMSTETVLLLKVTSLASLVTVYEVLGTARYIMQQDLRYYEPLVGGAIIYVALVFILTRILNWLERVLNKDRERPVSSVAAAQPAKA
jgi:polar amino acid transport system permease protein/octopine/nopaline transport system permease protein